MASEVITDMKVMAFTMTDSLEMQDNMQLFNENQFFLIFQERYAKNTYPLTPRWSIDFVGTLDDVLKDYIPTISAYFDSGLCQGGVAKTGHGFEKKIKQLLSKPGNSDACFFKKHAFNGYSWDANDFEVLSADQKQRFFPIKRYGLTRYATLLDSVEDVIAMAQEGVTIKHKAPEKSFDGQMVDRKWRGRPWLEVAPQRLDIAVC
jgi:hypothetical protein